MHCNYQMALGNGYFRVQPQHMEKERERIGILLKGNKCGIVEAQKHFNEIRNHKTRQASTGKQQRRERNQKQQNQKVASSKGGNGGEKNASSNMEQMRKLRKERRAYLQRGKWRR